jgi:hypothetical protein
MTADESQRFLDAASSTAYGFMFDLAFFLNGMGGRFSPRTVNLRSPALIKQNTASIFIFRFRFLHLNQATRNWYGTARVSKRPSCARPFAYARCTVPVRAHEFYDK